MWRWMSVLGFSVLSSTEFGRTPLVPPSPSPSPSETPPSCSPLSCVVSYCHWFGERSLPEFIVCFQTSSCLGPDPRSTVAFLHDKCWLSWTGQAVQDELLCSKAQWWCRFSGQSTGTRSSQLCVNTSVLCQASVGWYKWQHNIAVSSEVKSPLSVDSREAILFVIPPAYCNNDS